MDHGKVGGGVHGGGLYLNAVNSFAKQKLNNSKKVTSNFF